MIPGQLAKGCSGDQHEITGGCSNCPPITSPWPPPHGMREWGAGLGGPMSFLYGRVRQDFMHSTPEQVWQEWFVETGGTGETIIEQWSTVGFEIITPSTSKIIEFITDAVADEAGFVEAAVVIDEAGEDPEVVAAFDAARNLMMKKAVGWRFTHEMVAVGTMSTRWTSSTTFGWTSWPQHNRGFDIPNMHIEWRTDSAT